MHKKGSLKRSAAISLTVAALLTICSQPASAIQPSGVDIDSWANFIPASTLKIMRAQEKLEPAVTMFYDAARKEGGSGFASVAFEGHGLTLYYKGDPSRAMRLALAQARRLGKIVVHRVPYSRVDLIEAARRLEGALNGSNYQSIDLNYETGSITIASMPPATEARYAAQRDSKAARAGLPKPPALRSVRTALEGIRIGVPVIIVDATSTFATMSLVANSAASSKKATRPNTIAWGRNNDYAPYNAGGIVKNYDAPILQPGQSLQCTSGFAVTVGSTTRVLTAAHCGTPPDAFYDGGSHTSTDLMGSANGEDWDKDILTIGARGAGLMFTGGVGSTTYVNVNSWGYWAAGEYLCQSGATGGEECALRTDTSGNYTYLIKRDSDGDSFYVHGMIQATKQDSGHASVPGDSGAPVFAISGNGAKAKGVLSGGDTKTTNSQILFQDMADVINDFGYPVTQ